MAKGDIRVRNAPGTMEILTVGADGTYLKADSAQTLGMTWATPGGTGDVQTQGTVSADNRVVRYHETTGDYIQESAVTIDDSGNMSGVGTLGSGAITSTGKLTLSVASQPITLTGATDAKILITHASGLQLRNAGDTATVPLYASVVNCSQLLQSGGATNTMMGIIEPGTDATYNLGTSSAGYAHLYLGGATSADIHAGIDVAFRNMADSAYQTIDCNGVKVGGTTVINSSGIVSNQVVSLNFIIDGGGSAITTGSKGFIEIPFAMTVTGWTILGDVSGSIVVDVNRATYSAFDPSTMSSIAGSELPTISTALKGQDLSLTTWTDVTLDAGDILEFEVDSCTSITKCTVALRGTRA